MHTQTETSFFYAQSWAHETLWAVIHACLCLRVSESLTSQRSCLSF